MERYRSAGVATIAALIAADRPGEGGPRPVMARPQGGADPAATGAIAGDARRDFSRIGRRCERAVLTVYSDLLAHGSDDAAALRACTTLYRMRHPEASPAVAQRLVGAWIDHHRRRDDAGPTHGCACE